MTATTKSPPGTGSVSDARLLAAQLFNETWRLLGQEQRTRADDDRMVHTAHASRYHWGQVPAATPAHLARGEWLISRVYAVLQRPEPALYHARRVLDLCQDNGIGDFDLAFAYEALARAHASAGAADQARDDTDQALAAARHIADDEDRPGSGRPGNHSRPAPVLVARSWPGRHTIALVRGNEIRRARPGQVGGPGGGSAGASAG
jgi:tetratricopeptide (TPR) repeat protein